MLPFWKCLENTPSSGNYCCRHRILGFPQSRQFRQLTQIHTNPQFRLAARFFCMDANDSLVSGLFFRKVMSTGCSHSMSARVASLTNTMMRSLGASLPIAFNTSAFDVFVLYPVFRWWRYEVEGAKSKVESKKRKKS